MAKMGRPKKEIDWNIVKGLCRIHCTQLEIASVIDISEDTLVRRIKSKYKMTFAEYYKKNSSKGKISLRRYQFELAQRNVSMAIWLGKQWLGQRDDPVEDQIELPSGFDLTEI